LDILTTKDPAGAGAIARYLGRTGEGIQQVELLVRDIDLATNILRSKFGVQPIYPATRAGADETRVNFFLVAAADGPKTLIELVQASATNSL
jgi:methylmalonyl-CoA/ethylmalonyl-CoA epimerase